MVVYLCTLSSLYTVFRHRPFLSFLPLFRTMLPSSAKWSKQFLEVFSPGLLQPELEGLQVQGPPHPVSVMLDFHTEKHRSFHTTPRLGPPSWLPTDTGSRGFRPLFLLLKILFQKYFAIYYLIVFNVFRFLHYLYIPTPARYLKYMLVR